MTERIFAPRAAYRDLAVYRNDAVPVEVDLGDNTNQFGTAPSALATVREWTDDPSRYPTLTTAPLRQAIAEWLGVEPGQVLAGCGSNDLIDSTMRAFVDPGSTVAFAAPTFVMTAHFARANSLRPVPVQVRPDFQPDVDAMLATGAPLIYLASPNNPAATLTEAGALDRLLDRAPGLVILDEAYAEFAGVSRVGEAARRGNVLVTRTFSKAWGLAGLRVGYAVGSAALIEELEKARGPYKVNALAERAATAAVRHDRAWLAGIVAQVLEARAWLVGALRDLGLAPLESAANFVGLPVPDAPAAARHLAARGLGVRAFRNLPHVGDLLRITVGPIPVMERVARALGELPR